MRSSAISMCLGRWRRASNAGIDAGGDRGGYVWGAGDGIVSELRECRGSTFTRRRRHTHAALTRYRDPPARRLRRGGAAARWRDRRKWRKGIWPRMERASHRTNGAHPSSDKRLPRSPARYQRIRGTSRRNAHLTSKTLGNRGALVRGAPPAAAHR